MTDPEGGMPDSTLSPAALKRISNGLLVFPDDAVIPDHCTPEMIADPSLGACARMREGCIELGPWLPNYQGHVCGACVRADQADIRAHRWPFPGHGGPGIPGQYG